MARRFRARFGPLGQACACALLAVLAALAASAEPTPTPTPAPSQPSPVRTPPVPTPKPAARPSPTAQPKPTRTQKPDEWTEARRVFEQLSPDQKNKFLDNLDQWKAMSPEEQELFRDRELFRREKIAEEIQDAIVKSGLRLDDDQREVYALRYTQERRKIEEALRKEIDIKRRAMVGDMLVRLKTEFTQAPPAENSSP